MTEYIGFISNMNDVCIDEKQPIVRCRECRYYEYWEFRDGRTAHDCARGGDYLFDTEPNGFCAWGERRGA